MASLGTARTLKASAGTWSNNPDRYGYQWLRRTGGDCVQIAGATGDSYVLRGNSISEAEAVRYCAQTFRSYDSGSRTYLAYSGQRVSCPQ